MHRDYHPQDRSKLLCRIAVSQMLQRSFTIVATHDLKSVVPFLYGKARIPEGGVQSSGVQDLLKFDAKMLVVSNPTH